MADIPEEVFSDLACKPKGFTSSTTQRRRRQSPHHPITPSPIMFSSLQAFPLFNSFPLEIQSMVLQACPPNDQICLSLANKNLYELADKKQKVTLSQLDDGPFCGISKPDMNINQNIWGWRYNHRPKCHELCLEEHNIRRQADGLAPLSLKKCRTSRYGSDHCECFSRKYKLHSRLKNWTPKGLNFCGHCDKFTTRKPRHNGRCYHGRPKCRKYEGNYWTHRPRRGGFGTKLWKKWFNNRAMNSLESRLESGREKRAGESRYSLRKLGPKKVDTRIERDNNSMESVYRPFHWQ